MRGLVRFGMVVAAIAGAVAWWRRHPRLGAAWVNRVADPWLIRQGVVAGSNGELGLLEHVGRSSGTVRVTPIHPVRTTDGFRIVVPLGAESQWARNVIAAGRCRIQVGQIVHELDEPRLVGPSAVAGLPMPAARLMDWLGFRYLLLRQFAEHEGTLETRAAEAAAAEMEATQVIPNLAPVEALPTAL